MTDLPTATPTPTPDSTPTTPPTPAPAPQGRPRILDDFKRLRFCSLVTAGFNIDRAARAVGCAASTIHREVRRNLEFRRQLRDAMLTRELGPLNTVRRAAETNWRASAWYLERIDPQQFGRKSPRYITPEELTAFATTLTARVMESLPDQETGQLARKQIYTCFKELDESFRTRGEICRARRANK